MVNQNGQPSGGDQLNILTGGLATRTTHLPLAWAAGVLGLRLSELQKQGALARAQQNYDRFKKAAGGEKAVLDEAIEIIEDEMGRES